MNLLLAAIGYIALSGGALLPQGGNGAGGGMVHLGAFALEYLAIEGEIGAYERNQQYAVQGLWRWQGGELYNRFFGYSRFDPFFTFGAKGYYGENEGNYGPCLGVGAFYYLDDNWSIRADLDAALLLDTRREMLYSAAIGLQYDF